MQQQPKPWTKIPAAGQLFRPSEVCELTGLCKAQIYNLINEGVFPPFIKIGKRASAMPQTWLDAYIAERAAIALEARSGA